MKKKKSWQAIAPSSTSQSGILSYYVKKCPKSPKVSKISKKGEMENLQYPLRIVVTLGKNWQRNYLAGPETLVLGWKTKKKKSCSCTVPKCP